MALLKHKRNKQVSEFVDNNFALDRKIKEALTGVKASVQWSLQELPRPEDKELIADFILSYTNESEDGMPMSSNTKRAYIDALVYLARYHSHKKSFKEMTKIDIIDGYLNSLKKDYDKDPNQKWVNTYTIRLTKYLAFYKWLTQPDLKREERQTPPQLKGFRYPRRKTKTHVKREDFWTPEEHKVFLDNCEDIRLACYHAIARETGGRPGELLALKIGDLKIQTSPSTGKRYAEIWIGRSGKMKRGRPVTISDAIPYFNTWVHVHPRRDRPQEAYLFPSRENKAKYYNTPLVPDSLRHAYARVIEEQFPKLLDDPTVPLEEKQIIRSLIFNKPHYPYLMRHEFATEVAPKLSRLSFNQLMGHSESSKMQDVYVQALGNEGNMELQIMKGIRTREDTISPVQAQMRPKYCPVCGESNKQAADFCFKCNWIISKKGVEDVKKKDAEITQEIQEMNKSQQEMKKELDIVYDALRSMQVIKEFDEEHKKLLIENPKMRELAKKIEEEEEELIREELQEGEEWEQKKQERIINSLSQD